MTNQPSTSQKSKFWSGKKIALYSFLLALLTFIIEYIISNRTKNDKPNTVTNYYDSHNTINSIINSHNNNTNSQNVNSNIGARQPLESDGKLNPVNSTQNNMRLNAEYPGEHLDKRKYDLNNVEFVDVRNDNSILFSGQTDNSIDFDAHINIHHVYGKARIADNVFKVISGNVRGTLSLSNDATGVVASLIKDSNIPVGASMKRKE